MHHPTKLDEEGLSIINELWAIFDEHLPEELRQVAREKVQAIQGNCYSQADVENRRLYRCLVGMVPEHEREVRLAIAYAFFDGGDCDSETFYTWANDIEWALTPREALPMLAKIHGRQS